jgi:predicted dehydrogenase
MVLVRTGASLVSAGTERTLVEFAGKSLLGKAASRPDLLRQALTKARREGLLAAAQAAFGRLDEPMSMGYSSAGTVVEVGAGVSEFKAGDRVACAGGGYAVHAEYAVVPVNLVAPIADNVDFEQAAFSTLGAIVLHGFRLAEQQVSARVAVIGLGLLGQLAASVAAAAGCRVLGLDVDAERVKLARRRGLQAATNDKAAQQAAAFTEGQGFDAVLVCAATESSEPLALAGELARDRANIVVVGDVGMEISRRQFYAKELNVIVSRSYGPGRYDPGYEEAGLDYPIGQVRWTEGRNLAAFADLLASGAVDVSALISHKFPIDEAPKAYALISEGGAALGVLLTYADAKGKPAKTVEFAPAKPLAKDVVGLGVLGAGNFARNTLLPAIKGLKGLELVGIASASGRAAGDLGQRFGFRYAGSDPDAIIKDKQVNAVAILTRHHLHAEQTLAALAAGKAVYCEKPLALNEKALASIEKALAKKDAPLLTVGYNRRFAPLALELKSALEENGEPLAAHMRVNAGLLPADHWLHDPAQGGGRLLGEGCHFIDFLTFLVGQAPNSVYAQALPDGGVYRQDNLALTLGFPDGSVGTLHYLANGDPSIAKERLEVFSGGLVAELDDFRELRLTENGRMRKSGGRQEKGHHAAWQRFVQALRQGDQPPIPYDQLFGGMRATFSALESLNTGKSIQIS